MNDKSNILQLSDSSTRLQDAYEDRIKELERKLLALLSRSEPAN